MSKKHKSIIVQSNLITEILNNNKTQIRKYIKRTPSNDDDSGYGFWKEYDNRLEKFYIKDYTNNCIWYSEKEYIDKFVPYRIGDILYIKETWLEHKGKYYFKADTPIDKKLRDEFKWNSPIHMTEEISRLKIKITNIRIERLLDISIEDIKKEGFHNKDLFLNNWNNNLNKKLQKMYSSENNPWILVYDFEKL